MHARRSRTLLPVVIAVIGLSAACADKAADEAATTSADSTAMAAALQPPADLKTVADAYLAAWNADDPVALGAYYTEDAMLRDDTTTFTGRTQIVEQYLTPNLPAISNLRISEETWTQVGTDYMVAGKYAMTITTPDGTMEATGRYDETWTLPAGGTWQVRAMNSTPDAPPPPPPATTGQ